MMVAAVAFLLILLIAINAGFLLLLDFLICGLWLRKKSEKWNIFYKCSMLFLSVSFLLPKKMKKYGVKHWWIGIILMSLSPAALVTYVFVALVIYCCPLPLRESECPKYEDVVAMTELEDFPSFSYVRNDRWRDDTEGVKIWYKFDEELSAAYKKKLQALCDNREEPLWDKVDEGTYPYRFRRDWKKYDLTIGIGVDEFIIVLENDGSYDLDGLSRLLGENTGVSWPNYELAYSHHEPCGPDYTDTYILMLDKKPSNAFIQQIEKSGKWKKKKGEYVCSSFITSSDELSVTLRRNSRVVYVQLIGY
jgi:hypothetical protein